MAIDRRMMLGGTAAMMAWPGGAFAVEENHMFGMIGRMKAVVGKREALLDILLASSGAMPGCLSYIVAKDLSDPDAIWITEAWDSKESHDASLKLPQVRDAIAKARPLIAGFDSSAETQPIFGTGLDR
ncbi:antibiotic biosynthesis monooxygenase [Sphingomonas panacisoli]|uniref:Antibiotic biosynthesis monooxygenase n=1 Tax=Sphingomonas panacisoli TaxID=1813879 RepID=A0A5B8LFH1_9SPHN|nr:putative quinol monooxygenase [Sphingomonas panacisoli]QDZ06495.1 antibiotic biosynthesis monooxygenase [Sphingomonas panacisoli]